MRENSVCLRKRHPNLKGEDIQEGIAAVISVKLTDAQFEGQTKAKLGNTSMGSMVTAMVGEKLAEYLEEIPFPQKS